MLTKSKLFAIAAIAALVYTSSALALDRAGPNHRRDAATHSERQVVRNPAGAKAKPAVRPLTPVERLEPFTAEEKAILDAPDPYHHPDEF